MTLLFALSKGRSPPPAPAPPPPPADDFAARSTGPGVVRFCAFDDPADFSTGSGGLNGAYGFNFGIMPPSGTSDYTLATRDTTVKASGASSLKFTVPSLSGADSSGAWFMNFSTDLLTQFDSNQQFFIQWRQRFSPEFISNQYTGGGGFKNVIIGTGDQAGPTVIFASCEATTIVMTNYLQNGFPILYNSCTGSTSHGPYDGFYESINAGTDFKLQNARVAPMCLYTQSPSNYFPPNGNCFGYVADEWMTFQIGVQLGPRVSDEWQNSYVRLWGAREGQPSQLLVLWGPYNLTAGLPSANERFGKVWLTPYNTGKSGAASFPIAYTWYDELIVSRNWIADPAPAEPTWRSGQAVNEWRQITGTAMSTAPIGVATYPTLGTSGPQSKVIAWNGFALDTRDSFLYSAANGGHLDYAGNEVDRIGLHVDAPIWAEVKTATPVGSVTNSAAHYADGRPTSRHSYYGKTVNEVRNRVMTWGGSRWFDGNVIGNVDGFNPTTNNWDAAGTYVGSSSLSFLAGPAVVDDKDTGDVYVFSNWHVYKWTNATNTWAQRITQGTIYGIWSASAFDTKRRRILVLGGNGNDKGYYDVGSNTISAFPTTLNGDNNGMAYDARADAYLLRIGTTTYSINAGTNAVTTLTTTGPPPATAPNGPWRRWLYVPALRGIVYVPTYTDNIWFLRTS